ncbi:hypothetical protein, partial [Salmonella sp. SAL4359]|uniref:hypothetical protein n=1 Tax=Salmonella sp. SAL4359 TaxID=3159880 RepID=UPI003979A698
DDLATVHLSQDPLLAGYALPPACAEARQAAQGRIQTAHELVRALHCGDREAFEHNFDAQAVRAHAQRFEPYREQVLEWVGQLAEKLDVLGLG